MPGTYFLRAMGALGSWNDSAQSDLVAQEGYEDKTRWWLTVDGARWVAGDTSSLRVGLGGALAYAYASSESTSRAPRLRASTYGVLAQAPITFALGSPASVILTPRVGWGGATLGFGGEVSVHSTVLYGGDAALLLVDHHLGLHVGWLTGRIAGEGTGRSYDPGSLYVGISGVLHD